MSADSSLAGGPSFSEVRGEFAANPRRDSAWRSELTHRVESYRARRRKLATNLAQSHLPFDEPAPSSAAVAVGDPQEPHSQPQDDFSFTVAIGRYAGKHTKEDSQLLIDVSLPPEALPLTAESALPPLPVSQQGLYPVAPVEERRLAALIDAACLLFACGGFLALFGSLGGQFTFSKLSAAVYSAAFAIVYLQYFALFTVFGGTTPGMMLRGLRVVDFSGEDPSPRQLLLRAAGYVLSAGTFFLGFLWALWDEDSLTWHDRLSHTYLSSAETLADAEAQGVLHQL